MLNDPSILRQVENPHLRQDGLISEYCDGYAFSQHPLFSRDPQALQIILYYDEVEVVNPLGSKTSTHKVGVFYYTLGNIDPKYRSQLKCMQLLCIAKRPVIKKYGTNVMLESFMDDLGELEKDAGHQFTVKGEMKSFAGTVVYFSGDNLASQEVGGFKIGSASALKCRECMGNADDVSSKFHENDFILRTPAGYDRHCTTIENSNVDISRVYGINYRSILNQSRYFHVIGGLPGDAMHDILEGVLQYECKEILKYAIHDTKYFSLDQLNNWIKDFDYGYSDISNKPSIISTTTLNSGTNSLKQRASQMWCLRRFLPVLIGAHIPHEDEKWKLYILLLEIMDIILSPCITANKASFLGDLIEEHHSTFVQLYPNASVIPKMHYMIHYPRTMLRLGPMIRSWCMRFEAKHGRLKKLASCIGNFTNIAWSLADRPQLRQCYEMGATKYGESFIEKPIEVGPGTQNEAQNTGYFNFLQDLVPDLRPMELIHETNWCTIYGTKYRKEAVVHTGYSGILPEFSIVSKICTLGERPLSIRNLFFVLEEVDTVNYDSHIHAFAVGNVHMHQNIKQVIRQTSLVTFRPMHTRVSVSQSRWKVCNVYVLSWILIFTMNSCNLHETVY